MHNLGIFSDTNQYQKLFLVRTVKCLLSNSDIYQVSLFPSSPRNCSSYMEDFNADSKTYCPIEYA